MPHIEATDPSRQAGNKEPQTISETERHTILDGDGPPWWWALAQISAIAFHMPLALLTSDTRAVASTRSIIVVGAGLATLGIVVLLLLARFGVPKWKALTWVSVAILTFWHGVGEVGLPGPDWVVQVAAILLVAAAAGRFSHHRYMKSGLLAISLTLAVVLGVSTLASASSAEPIVEIQQTVESTQLSTRPDIYLIVLDGYGRTDVIEELFGYDNRAFESRLAARGFDVLEEAETNYTVTHFSIPAMLNMSYMHPHEGPIGTQDLIELAEDIGGDNELVRILKHNDYRYVHGETVTPFNRCGDHVDVCLRGPWIDVTAFRLLQGTIVGDLLRVTTTDPSTSLNQMRIDQMNEWSELESEFGSGPRFTFLHLILPHPPLFLDANCVAHFDSDLRGSIINDGDIEEGHLDKRKEAWLDQVECANQTTLGFLDQIDDDALVVITSDHGPDSAYRVFGNVADLTNEEISERVPTFTAVRMPQCADDVPQDVTLVNLFRYVLACLADEPPDPLPNRTYVASFGGYVFEVKP